MKRHYLLPFLVAAASCAAPAAAPTAASPIDVASPTAAAASTTSAARPAASAVDLFVKLDPGSGQLPEGLAVSGNTAYVGFAPSGAIVTVDLESNKVTPFAELPKPVPSKGFMTGLALDGHGNLYAALVSFVPEVQAGIYRVPSAGGRATLFAKHPQMPFPNGLAFDEHENLYVTDSGSGSVFRVDPKGKVERWVSGDLLSGSKDACEKGAGSFDIGANGIVVEGDAVYVDNNDKATLVKIARKVDGKAGAPVVFFGPDCANLGGADGLLRDAKGDFVVAVNRQNKLVRVTRDLKVETIATGGSLDFPASLAAKGSTLFATNFALATASSGKPANPGLLRIEAP